MSYTLLNDDEILNDLAGKFDNLRRVKGIKDKELVSKGGTNGVAVSKFRSGENITLKTFIRLMRGLGELERLEKLLSMPDRYSPTGSSFKIAEKRVRGRKSESKPFSWGDEA